MQAIKLSAGLGVITFEGRFGPTFFKGGHNHTTGNQAICVEKGRRCLLFLSNDVRAESIYQRLTAATLGDPGMPWTWEGYTPYDQAPVRGSEIVLTQENPSDPRRNRIAAVLP